MNEWCVRKIWMSRRSEGCYLAANRKRQETRQRSWEFEYDDILELGMTNSLVVVGDMHATQPQ